MSNDVRVVIRGVVLCGAMLIGLANAPALAQETAPAPAPEPALCPCPPPPPPPPVWTGSFGAGLAITQGNKDTSNFNLSFDLKRDPKTRTVFKAEGLYILASEDGSENADRIRGRVERLFTERAYVFGQVGYVRDRFKDIDYLIAPTAGVGYKIVANDCTAFDVDTSVGMVFEKNTGFDLETDGAVMAGETFSHKLSANAAFTQGATALWKMDDFGDALYTFSAGIAASVTTRVQLKLEFQDVYKTRPTGLLVDSNDIAFITAFVYKF